MSRCVVWWSCQSPVAHSCGLLNHPNGFRGGMFKLKAKFVADLLLYAFNHFESYGHTVHKLAQWHLPPPTDWYAGIIVHTCIPVPLPWLPGYISVMQTIVIVLTMAGLFLGHTLWYIQLGNNHHSQDIHHPWNFSYIPLFLPPPIPLCPHTTRKLLIYFHHRLVCIT